MSRKKKTKIEAEEEKLSIAIPVRIKSDLRKRPYGLCEGVGISTSGMSPREAWGEWNAYRKAERERKKSGKKSEPKKPFAVTAAQKLNVKQDDKKPVEVVKPQKPAAVQIPKLSASDIETADNNSHFDRGTASEKQYYAYTQRILEMDISDEKKQQLINELHKRWSRLLSLQAAWVPWTVAGPARYNAKKLDKGDKVMQTSAEISDWLKRTEKSVTDSKRQYRDESAIKAKQEEEWIRRFAAGALYRDPSSTMIANQLVRLAPHDPKRYVELYEEFDQKYHFRGNTNAAKLYNDIRAGRYQGEKKPEKLHETDNLNAYKKTIDAGERVFMKFTTRPKPQLIYALKRRGWHWNALEGAWSVPVGKYDEKFVAGIEANYGKYL